MLPSIWSLHFNIAITFQILVARILKFGPETIYLVLKMTKDSLFFCLCFHREINFFVELLCCPVSSHNNNNIIVHKFRQQSDLLASLALAK